MIPAPFPDDEARRVRSLRALDILDTPAEARFDRLTRLAQLIFGVPISLVSLVDSDRQWFKSKQGIEATETPRSVSFCGHAILRDEVMVVEDARLDERFRDNPLVTGDPNVRFYAGAPLKAPDGAMIGTLCIIDTNPRTITPNEVLFLEELARCANDQFTLTQRVFERTAEVNEQRREKELLLDAIGEGLYGLDTEGRVSFINPAGAKMLGYTVEELLGQDFHAKCHHTHGDGRVHLSEDCPVNACLKDGRPRSLSHHTLWHKNGTKVPTEHTCTPIFDDNGRISGVMVVFRDITERQVLQAQLVQAQKMEAVGQLTGGIAHDFNNLLGVMIGNLDLAESMLEGAPEAHKCVQNALDSALRGAELTKQLLSFARRQMLSPKIMDINADLTKMKGLINQAAREIDLKFALAPELWPTTADPAQFESAILNLTINARHAMPGGGALEILTENVHLDEAFATLHPTVPAGDYIRVSVRDTGTGMPPETLARVFEPFFTTKDGEGTGLGLSMVYGFVSQSKGHVAIDSEVGRGTTVMIYLPRAQAFEQGAVATAQKSALPKGSEVVLLVEDNLEMSAVAARQLISLGYRVLQAENAADALTLLESGAPVDLLFSDIIMPGGINGLELADEAARRWPAMKVLMTTGFHRKTMVGQEIKRRLLLKPYRIADLAAAVRAALDGEAAVEAA